ncbi:MAG: aminotransferase class V-fold PLP-dependent enzyme [Planctomycetaceae bacterium]|jgi:cysteine desulfurase family protein|nr:aminotransferase class V-fold PLP-dependent enzyme [Planctomycetaceae bacterium]
MVDKLIGDELVYLDNAATSWLKPESVYVAVERALREQCGNPGRSGHRLAVAAGQVLDDARLLCARLFNAEKPEQIIFTANATIAANMVLKGVLNSGDHVITSSLEHNAVVRPLHRLEQTGVSVSKVSVDLNQGILINVLEQVVTAQTKLLICNHISNVFGTINDLEQIGRFCRERGILFAVDAAQSAGCRKIDVQAMFIDFLIFSGHKSLFGPQGTGGLYLRPDLRLETILEGGTGNRSELLEQPEQLPYRLESGTPNTSGLAGLSAGIRFILETGIETITEKEKQLVNRLLTGLYEISGIYIIGPKPEFERGCVVSVQLEKFSPAQAASILDSSFNIAVRSGLHCAADAHRFMNTLKNGGTLRISPNYFNENQHIDSCLDALRKLS